jgi:hypothetical protein
MIAEHLTQFAGRPVVEWQPDTPLANPDGTLYRLSLGFEEVNDPSPGLIARLTSLFSRSPARHAERRSFSWSDKLAQFLEAPMAARVPGIVVGAWGPMYQGEPDLIDCVRALAAARDRLPGVKALFIGDVLSEECEISWIEQCDLSLLFAAYPDLEHLGVRGSNGLSLGKLALPRLQTLVLESGGLPGQVVREVAAASLPELTHLELWLGTDNYGGDSTLEDLAPILTGERLPKLCYLGLRDSENADQVAAAIARSPLLERIRVLDLSLGTLGDEGAAALLESPAVARLEKLDIHHHYCSEEMVAKLQQLGIEVDASDTQKPDRHGRELHHYVAVSE